MEGHFESYRIDSISDEASFLEMLDVLNERLIAEDREPVVFDHDCREGICGSCSLMIDGQAHGPEPAPRHVSCTCASSASGRDRRRAVAGDLVPDHQGSDGRSRCVRSDRRERWIHHRADRRRARCEPDPIPKVVADAAMDAAECIGCGACVAACPNGAANLFTAAKVSHLNLLPQGQPERFQRVEAMVETMDEYFGSCTNHGECEAACPKSISIDFIALMNKDYLKAKLANRRELSRT